VWKNARERYCTNDGVFSTSMIKDAATLVKEELYRWPTDGETCPVLWTKEQAVLGFRLLPSMNRKSSAGPPWSDGITTGKRFIFGDTEFTFDTPLAKMVFAMVDQYLDLFAQDVCPEMLCQDYLKSELVKLQKALDEVSRSFSAVSLVFNICEIIMFGSWINYIKAHKIDNGVAVGINPYDSGQWGLVYHNLQHHEHKDDGDHKGFDGHQAYIISYVGVLDVCEHHYSNATARDRRIRKNMMDKILGSCHRVVIDGIAYWVRWYGSNPSGQVLTTTLNTINGKILIKMTYIRSLWHQMSDKHYLFYQSGMVDLKKIVAHTHEIAFGDDVCMSWDDEIPITHLDMEVYMRDSGMVFTDAAKSENPAKWKNDTKELIFLMRGFFVYKGRILAPLKLSVILEMINWTRTSVPWIIFVSVIQLAILELALHGPEVWSLWAPPIIEEASRQNMVLMYTTFEGCLNRITSMEAYY
jgi:hypothetical protein